MYVFDVRCPTCGASKSKHCIWKDGRDGRLVHSARRDLAEGRALCKTKRRKRSVALKISSMDEQALIREEKLQRRVAEIVRKTIGSQ